MAGVNEAIHSLLTLLTFFILLYFALPHTVTTTNHITEIKALLMAGVNAADVDDKTMTQIEQHAARLELSGNTLSCRNHLVATLS